MFVHRLCHAIILCAALLADRLCGVAHLLPDELVLVDFTNHSTIVDIVVPQLDRVDTAHVVLLQLFFDREIITLPSASDSTLSCCGRALSPHDSSDLGGLASLSVNFVPDVVFDQVDHSLLRTAVSVVSNPVRIHSNEVRVVVVRDYSSTHPTDTASRVPRHLQRCRQCLLQLWGHQECTKHVHPNKPCGVNVSFEIDASDPRSVELYHLNAPAVPVAGAAQHANNKTTPDLEESPANGSVWELDLESYVSSIVSPRLGAAVVSPAKSPIAPSNQENVFLELASAGDVSRSSESVIPRQVSSLRSILTSNLRRLYSDLRENEGSTSFEVAPHCVAPHSVGALQVSEFSFGSLRWLVRELNTAGGYLVSDSGNEIGPAAPGKEIMIYGWDSGDDFDQVWVNSAWSHRICNATQRRKRRVGQIADSPNTTKCLNTMDLITLGGFRRATNAGMFQVLRIDVSSHDQGGFTLWLGEIVPSRISSSDGTMQGAEELLTEELEPPTTALAFGCFGCMLQSQYHGNATSRAGLSIQRLRPPDPDMPNYVQPQGMVPPDHRSSEFALCIDRRVNRDRHCSLEDDETVRLIGFGHQGNNGLFRVSELPLSHKLVVDSTRSSEATGSHDQSSPTCFSLHSPYPCRHGLVRSVTAAAEIGGRSNAQIVGDRGHFAALTAASHQQIEARHAKPAFWPSAHRFIVTPHYATRRLPANVTSNISGSFVDIELVGTYPLAAFQVGEIVQLRNFGIASNNGIFKVAGVARANSSTHLQIVPVGARELVARSRQWNELVNAGNRDTDDGANSDDTSLLCPRLPTSFGHLAAPIEGTLAVSERLIEAVRCPHQCLSGGEISPSSQSCCSGHGACKNAMADSIWKLPETITALGDASNEHEPSCACTASFGGPLCDLTELPCPNGCSGHGTCDSHLGRCNCEFTWGSLDCSARDLPCPNNCSQNGKCDRTSGKCMCDLTWGGVACEFRELPCPKSCSGNGICDQHSGKCHCFPTWGGVDCGNIELACMEPCCGSAVCDTTTGQCECPVNSNRTGLRCCDVSPPCPCQNNPKSHGMCDAESGKCLCAAGWGGVDCTINICEHGALAAGFPRCICQPNWYCPLPHVTCANSNDRAAWLQSHNHSKLLKFTGIGGQGQHRRFPDVEFNLGLYGNQEGVLYPTSKHARAAYNASRTVQRYLPCSCSKFCLADGSDQDTCHKHGVGCSEAGDCLCKKYFTGKHCELPLVPTGEINQRNYQDLSPRTEDLYKALFLVGTEPCPLCRRTSPRTITAVALANVLNLCGSAASFESVYTSRQLAIWNETYSIFMAAKEAHRVDEEPPCPAPYSKMYFNQFMSACVAQPPLPTYVIRYSFRRMDRDFSGTLSLRELVVAELTQRGYLRPASCSTIEKPNASTIAGIQDTDFRVWLDSLDIEQSPETATAEAPSKMSSTSSKVLHVLSPPTLQRVVGHWTVIENSRIATQENHSFVNLCPGDVVRTALQNFQVVEVQYQTVHSLPTIMSPSSSAPQPPAKFPLKLLKVLFNETVRAPSQNDLVMWKFVPQNESLADLSASMHDASRRGMEWRPLDRLTVAQKAQVRDITGTSLPPPPFMDGKVFPDSESQRSGVNIVRTVYDIAVALWRRHDINLDFRLTYDEFSTAAWVDPAIACSMVDGCYEFVGQPDPQSLHWCKASTFPPATLQQCANDICSNVNGGDDGKGSGKETTSGDGGGEGGDRRHSRKRRNSKGTNTILTDYTGAGDFAPGSHRLMPGSLWIPNKFAWCDMSQPFSFPFCPSPNPFFNILIKMMISGMIKPAIDQIVAALIAGQSSVTALLKCLMPAVIAGKGKEPSPKGSDQSASGANSHTKTSGSQSTLDEETSCSRKKQENDGSFVEISFLELPVHCLTPMERQQKLLLQHQSLRKHESPASSFLETSSGASSETPPAGERGGDMVGSFQKSYFEALEKSMTATLTIDLTESLVVELHELLHSRLSQELSSSLEISLSHALKHYVTSAVGVAVSHAVSTLLNRMLPTVVLDSVKSTVTHTMTRSLTHSIGSSVVESLMHEHRSLRQPKAWTSTAAESRVKTKLTQQQQDELTFHCYECKHASADGTLFSG